MRSEFQSKLDRDLNRIFTKEKWLKKELRSRDKERKDDAEKRAKKYQDKVDRIQADMKRHAQVMREREQKSNEKMQKARKSRDLNFAQSPDKRPSTAQNTHGHQLTTSGFHTQHSTSSCGLGTFLNAVDPRAK